MKNLIKKFPQTVAVLAAIAAIFLFLAAEKGLCNPHKKRQARAERT